MVERGGRWVLGLVLLIASAITPSAAEAWHFEGLVYCDVNANGVIDGPDTRVLGVTVRATSLTANPGATYEKVTDLNGYYLLFVPHGVDDDYRVELVSGLPPGSSVVLPPAGFHSFSLNDFVRFVNGVDFLLSGCSSIVLPTPTVTAAPVETPTATVTATENPTPVSTALATPTTTDAATPTEEPTPTDVPTPTEVPTSTSSPAPTDAPTPTDEATPTITATAVESPSPSATTEKTVTPTPTKEATATPTKQATATPSVATTQAATPTVTGTLVPTETAAPEPSGTATSEPSETATPEPSETATPLKTSTPTPSKQATTTPTPGSTPGVFAPAYQCYEIDRATVPAIKDLPVEDVFGLALVDVGGRGKVKRLCNPAGVNGQNPGAAADPNHLVGYVVNKRTPKLVTPPLQTVTNVFGTADLKVLRPILLAVPSAKSLAAPPAAPVPGVIDHYQCYAVGNAGTMRVSNVQVVDQFGTLTVDVKRPSRLCVAVDKRGEGILDPAAALMCYGVRASAGVAPFRGIDGDVFVHNQFGPDVLKVTRPTELCVPSTVTPSAFRRPQRRPR